MLKAFDIPLSWTELFKRTAKDTNEDDCLGLAAQLAYYAFLALFPTVLVVLALVSFLPVDTVIETMVSTLRPIVSPEVLSFFEEQLSRVAEKGNTGILTFGLLAAVWSSSAGMVAIIGSLNRAYDIDEGRPWWKVRLIAMLLTVALAVLVIVALGLVMLGPTVADYLGATLHLHTASVWAWKILQWPLVFFMVSTAIGLVYYFAPDAEQDWVWVTPGAVLGTLLWLVASLALKFYAANFGDYNETYGTVGGIIVLLLWFYMGSFSILVGAEMNAEIEHASPHGKAPGEKLMPGQKKKIGLRARRAYEERHGQGDGETDSQIPGMPEPSFAYQKALPPPTHVAFPLRALATVWVAVSFLRAFRTRSS